MRTSDSIRDEFIAKGVGFSKDKWQVEMDLLCRGFEPELEQKNEFHQASTHATTKQPDLSIRFDNDSDFEDGLWMGDWRGKAIEDISTNVHCESENIEFAGSDKEEAASENGESSEKISPVSAAHEWPRFLADFCASQRVLEPCFQSDDEVQNARIALPVKNQILSLGNPRIQRMCAKIEASLCNLEIENSPSLPLSVLDENRNRNESEPVEDTEDFGNILDDSVLLDVDLEAIETPNVCSEISPKSDYRIASEVFEEKLVDLMDDEFADILDDDLLLNVDLEDALAEVNTNEAINPNSATANIFKSPPQLTRQNQVRTLSLLDSRPSLSCEYVGTPGFRVPVEPQTPFQQNPFKKASINSKQSKNQSPDLVRTTRKHKLKRNKRFFDDEASNSSNASTDTNEDDLDAELMQDASLMRFIDEESNIVENSPTFYEQMNTNRSSPELYKLKLKFQKNQGMQSNCVNIPKAA